MPSTMKYNTAAFSTLEVPSVAIACPQMQRMGSAGSLKRVRTITKAQGQAIIQRRSNSRPSSPSDNASVRSLKRVRTITKLVGRSILQRRSNSRSPSPSDCGSDASGGSLQRVRTITKARGQAIAQRRNHARCGAPQMI
ncbi:hypothetical protein BD779DRAFT_1473768 [Infundibulicybe gibba]|nr:hypothetical protein BD779DRAFT_1473768 [Infundibulicybe gibba]